MSIRSRIRKITESFEPAREATWCDLVKAASGRPVPDNLDWRRVSALAAEIRQQRPSA